MDRKSWDMVLCAVILPAAAYWLITRFVYLGPEGRTALAMFVSGVGLLLLVKRHG